MLVLQSTDTAYTVTLLTLTKHYIALARALETNFSQKEKLQQFRNCGLFLSITRWLAHGISNFSLSSVAVSPSPSSLSPSSTPRPVFFIFNFLSFVCSESTAHRECCICGRPMNEGDANSQYISSDFEFQSYLNID